MSISSRTDFSFWILFFSAPVFNGRPALCICVTNFGELSFFGSTGDPKQTNPDVIEFLSHVRHLGNQFLFWHLTVNSILGINENAYIWSGRLSPDTAEIWGKQTSANHHITLCHMFVILSDTAPDHTIRNSIPPCKHSYTSNIWI